MTGDILLRAHDIEKRRGGRVTLRVTELAVRQGDVLALIGPNGAGKTTLLQVLASLIPPTSGRVLFHGQPVTTDSSGLACRRRQAMVFQEPLLFSTSVFDNVAAGLKIRGMDRDRIRERVERNLVRFGIGHLASRPARDISGGEAQRTSLARALATEPEILFLDEPFSALDPMSREGLIEDLGRVLHDTGITVVMTTHDHGEAMRLANRMAVMAEGRIRQLDSPARVFRYPVDRFVAAFVGMDNQLPAVVSDSEGGMSHVALAGCRLEVRGVFAAGAPVTFCVRPEYLCLYPGGSVLEATAINLVAGRVGRVVSLGRYARVQLDCGFPLTAVTTEAVSERSWLAAGEVVHVLIPPEAIHLIGE